MSEQEFVGRLERLVAEWNAGNFATDTHFTSIGDNIDAERRVRPAEWVAAHAQATTQPDRAVVTWFDPLARIALWVRLFRGEPL